MKRAVCPGSFDPITFGHLDIIERASGQFDEVIVAVLENRTKASLFTVQERMEMIRQTTSKYSNVKVDSWHGLLVDFCKENSIQAIVKGLRAVTDFDYEFQLAGMNRRLSPEVDTVLLYTQDVHQCVSSTLVREINMLGGDVEQFVSPTVYRRLRDKRAGAQPA